MSRTNPAMGFFWAISISLGIVVVLGALIFFYVGGNVLVKQQEAEESAELAARARHLVLPQLREFGVVSLSHEDAAERSGPLIFYMGTARTSENRLRLVQVTFKVAKFGTKQQWQVHEIKLDGERVYHEDD